jgi:hypothetical protein
VIYWTKCSPNVCIISVLYVNTVSISVLYVNTVSISVLYVNTVSVSVLYVTLCLSWYCTLTLCLSWYCTLTLCLFNTNRCIQFQLPQLLYSLVKCQVLFNNWCKTWLHVLVKISHYLVNSRYPLIYYIINRLW